MNRTLIALSLIGLIGLTALGILLLLPSAAATIAQTSDLPPLSPEYPFEAVADPGIPTLQAMVGDMETDAQALERILAYYTDHEAELTAALGEDDPTRLKALFSMYVVHISHIYGEQSVPLSLVEYMQVGHSHCGLYTRYQAQILDAFGMTWRIMYHTTAEHAWIETPINGQWEVFDPTVNVWIDTPSADLIAGSERQYRAFYTPMNDIQRPDAREHYWLGPANNPRIGWYNMPRLRMWMPGLGLYYTPETHPGDLYVFASAPGEGSDRNQPWWDGLN